MSEASALQVLADAVRRYSEEIARWNANMERTYYFAYERRRHEPAPSLCYLPLADSPPEDEEPT